MPTYSYVCKDCGHAFDIQQAFTDDALKTCPECQGALRKVFSAVGVVFKGSGFYRTDSRGSGSTAGSSGDKASGKTTAEKTADKGSSSSSGSSSGSSNASSTPSSSAPSPSTAAT